MCTVTSVSGPKIPENIKLTIFYLVCSLQLLLHIVVANKGLEVARGWFKPGPMGLTALYPLRKMW